MQILSFRHRRVVLDFEGQVQGLALPDLCSSDTHSGLQGLDGELLMEIWFQVKVC